MNSIAIPNWVYLLILLAVLLIAGVGEYLHLAPAGTFYTILVLVIGLIAPSPAFPHTTVQTPEANISAHTVDVQSPPK